MEGFWQSRNIGGAGEDWAPAVRRLLFFYLWTLACLLFGYDWAPAMCRESGSLLFGEHPPYLYFSAPAVPVFFSTRRTYIFQHPAFGREVAPSCEFSSTRPCAYLLFHCFMERIEHPPCVYCFLLLFGEDWAPAVPILAVSLLGEGGCIGSDFFSDGERAGEREREVVATQPISPVAGFTYGLVFSQWCKRGKKINWKKKLVGWLFRYT